MKRGSVYGESVFSDSCTDSDDDDPRFGNERACHILAGWSAGEESCALWNKIRNLINNAFEEEFLHTYLRYVKGRQFPMLIPQARLGLGERRRPDFVAFVPSHFWHFRQVAIQLDGAHTEEQREADAVRDEDVRKFGYEVISVRPKKRGHVEEARALAERFEKWMDVCEQPLKVRVASHIQGMDDVPF